MVGDCRRVGDRLCHPIGSASVDLVNLNDLADLAEPADSDCLHFNIPFDGICYHALAVPVRTHAGDSRPPAIGPMRSKPFYL
jgi:hypothetical protein